VVKKIPWGRKDPAIVASGVVGNGACMGGGSGPCRTHFGCISALKNMLLVKKINLCGKKHTCFHCKKDVISQKNMRI